MLLPPLGASQPHLCQSLYTLPVSLFGMSVSAAELPAMSRALGSAEQVGEVLRQRLGNGLRRIAFFIVPSAMAFIALGDVITGALYQTGQFKRDAAIYVWGILAGSAIGLLASTLGRLYASTFYALHDTRTPLRFAIIRVTLTTVLGYLCAIPLPPLLGIAQKGSCRTHRFGRRVWLVGLHFLRQTLTVVLRRTGLARLCSPTGLGAGWGRRRVVAERVLGTPLRYPSPNRTRSVRGRYLRDLMAGVPEARDVIARILRL